MNETVYKVMPCSKNIIFCKMEFIELERGNIIFCKMGFIESECGHPELVQIKKTCKTTYNHLHRVFKKRG